MKRRQQHDEALLRLLRRGRPPAPPEPPEPPGARDLVLLGLQDVPAARRELARGICRESFRRFVGMAWPVLHPSTPLVGGRVFDALCGALQAVTEGKVARLLVNVPPGFSKSMLVNVMWPAWEWGPRGLPHHRFISASYELGLATDSLRQSRDLMLSAWYQDLWPVTMKSDANEKCLVRGTQVLMADGTLRGIEDLRPGDRVQSSDGTRVVPDEVLHVVDTGTPEVFRVTLSDGTVVAGTARHRLYGWDGWVRVADLRPGDPLSVARRTMSQAGDLAADDAFLLALWLAEGSKSKGATSYSVSATAAPLVARLGEVAARRGWRVHPLDDVSLLVSAGGRQKGDTPLNLLRRHGAWGQRTDTIRVPAAVFSARDDVVREFVGTYLACDGCVSAGKSYAVIFSSASERMARDLMLLLRRLGVQSFLRQRPAGYRKNDAWHKCKDEWRLTIAAGSICWLASLPAYHKQDKLARLVRHVAGRDESGPAVPPTWRASLLRSIGWHQASGHRISPSPSGWSTRRRVAEAARLEGNVDLLAKLDGDLDWRAVVSVESIGRVQTYDVQTRVYNAFFAEGVMSHNTLYANTGTGWRKASSVGGALTGYRAHRVIVDDPHDLKRAESDVDREIALRWWTQTIPTRFCDPNHPVYVLIMQRLHVSDVSGHVLERTPDGWAKMILPMEYDPDRKCSIPEIGFEDWRTRPGELLWPERFSADAVRRLRHDMMSHGGSYAVAGQLQQRPIPMEGGMFRGLPQRAPESPGGGACVRGWDLAATEGGGDYTVGVLVRVARDRVWIEDEVRLQGSANEVREAIRATALRDGPMVPISIPQDPGQAGKAQVADLASLLAGYDVRFSLESGSKQDRARPLAAQWEAGNVTVLDRPWADSLVREVGLFPGGRKDRVDALSRAYAYLLARARGTPATSTRAGWVVSAEDVGDP